MTLRIDVLTLFPAMIEGPLGELSRAASLDRNVVAVLERRAVEDSADYIGAAMPQQPTCRIGPRAAIADVPEMQVRCQCQPPAASAWRHLAPICARMPPMPTSPRNK